MANRSTRFILKNNQNSAAPFSGATLLVGEPIVNTASGIMMFSGVTSGTNDWIPAGPNGNANFFEVGSNLYNLKIRNQITSYSGVSNLAGKFLSGTTNGFVLANISSITGVDTYVTGNTITASNNNTNTQNAQLLYNITPPNGPFFITTLDTFTTGGTYNNTTKQITFKKNSGPSGDYIIDLSGISVSDSYVTGGTITTPPSNNNINGVIGLRYNSVIPNDTYNLPFTDVFTTGFTYNPTNNTFTLRNNSGDTLNQSFNSVSGLTFSNLTAGRIPYVGVGGFLTDEAGFTYNTTTNTFSVPSDGSVSVGTGGLNVSGDAIIQGDLVVLGNAISAFTSQLYVEDPNITVNYNPTGNTTATSIGAGFTFQDGNGLNGGNVNLDIRALNTFTGLTSTQIPNILEYTASTGYSNRGLVTQLNDIILRSTDINRPNGVRVLTEFDTLDGGSF
jgi:hypothetical protein